MHRNLFAFTVLLAALGVSFQVHALCTTPLHNMNVAESTPTIAFTDNLNGTVTHKLTGLMWKQCAEGLSGAGCTNSSALTFTWANALVQARDSNFAGHIDWRLPNIKELESIVESCGYYPSINKPLFPATPFLPEYTWFWSGSSYVPLPTHAWKVSFHSGFTGADAKAGDGYVRLVRGGQFVDSFDAQAIPTLSEWGVILLAGMLGLLGIGVMRRR
jgi:hypothetical protein